MGGVGVDAMFQECVGLLPLRVPQGGHHLWRGVGAVGKPLPADDLALGGHAQLGGQLELGLGGGGVQGLLVLLVAAKRERALKKKQCTKMEEQKDT